MIRDRAPALALLAVGLTAIVGQVLLMRELVATFYGNELLIGLVLGAWLAWGAVGAWAGARLASAGASSPAGDGPEAGSHAARRVALGLALAALLLPAQLVVVRISRTLLGVTPGSLVELGPLVMAVVGILAPLCLLLGALFSLGTRLMVARGGTPGQAYVWDSAGALAGGIVFSFLLIRWFNPFQTSLLVAAADLAVALLVSGSLRRAWIGALLLAGMGAVALPAGASLEAATLRWQWPDLAFAADSPYGRLIVQARGSQRIFYTDGALAFETQGTGPEEVAHLPLLAHPAPRDVLLIGGGVAGNLREILKHPVSAVTYVELDPLLIEAAQAWLPPDDAAVLRDPRVRLALTDGRAFVQDAGLQVDVILLDLPEPATGALNRFYTVEFFTAARALLRPGGILALGLPSAENYWSPELARRNASIYHTLRAAFPHVVALPGERTAFLAGDQPPEVSPEVLANRLVAREIRTRWVTPGYIEDVLGGDRFAQVNAILQADPSPRLNRDLQPISYYYSLAFWLSRFYPSLRRAFESASLLRLWWLIAPLAVAVVVARARRAWAAPVAVAAVGLAAMILELVVLFGFQARRGSLYAEVSLLVTAFMGGLVLGGALGNRAAATLSGPRGAGRRAVAGGAPAAGPAPGADVTAGTAAGGRDRRLVVRALAGILAGIAVYSAALPILFTSPLPPRLAFPALALVGGGLAGMIFPLAVALYLADRRPSARCQGAGHGRQRPAGSCTQPTWQAAAWGRWWARCCSSRSWASPRRARRSR